MNYRTKQSRACRCRAACAVTLVAAFATVATPVAAQNEPIAVAVTIEFEDGRQAQWIEAFETHIVPGIQDAIQSGELVDFAYFESIAPTQAYDLLLVVRATSFAFFDRRQIYPHYAALFRRVGAQEGRRIIAEMSEWEAAVTVTLLRSYGWKP
ncbi:MAG: hypothetical protein JSW71_03825 [Gemmatimonadota bacterium]|nr:MAG: hypothetical protein JSW71_03825 [Gemmatimonadota bacterium]